MSRGIMRLTNLVESFGEEIDRAADQAAADLLKKKDRCLDAVATVKTTVGGMFDGAAAKAEDMINQMSNGDPTSGDSQNSAQSSDKAKTQG